MKKDDFINFLSIASPKEINELIEEKGKEAKLKPIMYKSKIQ